MIALSFVALGYPVAPPAMAVSALIAGTKKYSPAVTLTSWFVTGNWCGPAG